MTFPSRSFVSTLWIGAFATVGAAGCLCPPCAGKGAGGLGPVVVGSKQMIWDGDGAGSGAQAWESCDQKPGCKVKVGIDAGAGVNGSSAVKFHGEGNGWIGMGWNLFGWYPPDAGVDLTPYSHLTFQIRVEMKPGEGGALPDPGAAAILLGCSRNKFDSADAPIDKFMRGFTDGKWHKVQIPVSAFTKGKGAKWDPGSFWEFRISTWSGNNRVFDIYIDEIAAEKLQ